MVPTCCNIVSNMYAFYTRNTPWSSWENMNISPCCCFEKCVPIQKEYQYEATQINEGGSWGWRLSCNYAGTKGCRKIERAKWGRCYRREWMFTYPQKCWRKITSKSKLIKIEDPNMLEIGMIEHYKEVV